MNLAIKLRLAGLGLGIGLMGALIVLVTFNSQRQAREVRARLNQVDQESFRIADHFKDALREVNEKMRSYRNSQDPQIWEEFLKASQDLDLWIDAQGPKLKTQRERGILKDIDSAYETYVRLAMELHAQMQVSSEPKGSRGAASAFFEQSRHLSDLGQALARAHYESRNELLTHANRTLTQLRLSVLWLLGLLFMFGLGLAFGVYRDLIAPLRIKLVESQTLADRHEKLASLGLLAAGVAHEIRNPLTALKAALFIQQSNFQPGSREYGDAELVEREVLRLERIVNSFLLFARPADPEFATIPADLPLQEVQVLMADRLAKDNIQLIREDSTPLRIKADPEQIKQVMINLVQNAADSMDKRGTIILRTRHDRKRLHNGETNVVVMEVADTGKGIAPEVQKRLFDPFFTTKETGTGLGLSIAARIIEKHGGALQYRTQVDRGTTFAVVLPEAERF